MGFRFIGAEGQNRTADTVIFSHVLYQLSYLGTAGEQGSRALTQGPCDGETLSDERSI